MEINLTLGGLKASGADTEINFNSARNSTRKKDLLASGDKAIK